MKQRTAILTVILACFWSGGVARGQKIDVAKLQVTERQVVYKTVGDVELKMHVFEAAGRDVTKPAPAKRRASRTGRR